MKKVILTILVVVGIATNASAQKTSFGIVGGYYMLSEKVSIGNFGSLSATESGFFIGFIVKFKVSDKLSIQPELQWGSIIVSNETFNQILIPIMFQYSFADKVYVQLGPQLDFELDVVDSEEVRTLGVGLAVGAGYDIKDNLFIFTRYSFGLTDRIKDDDFGLSLKISTFQVGLGYRF